MPPLKGEVPPRAAEGFALSLLNTPQPLPGQPPLQGGLSCPSLNANQVVFTQNIVKGVKVCQNSCMMEISQVQYERIADCFPVHRGNVAYDNLKVLNAILYVMENGCKWRRLPERFGNWHTIYMRMSRWYKSGVLDKVFERLQHERLLRMRLEAVCLDSSCVKVHPDGTGALKKGGLNLSVSPGEDGPPRFIWLPRVPIAR